MLFSYLTFLSLIYVTTRFGNVTYAFLEELINSDLLYFIFSLKNLSIVVHSMSIHMFFPYIQMCIRDRRGLSVGKLIVDCVASPKRLCLVCQNALI